MSHVDEFKSEQSGPKCVSSESEDIGNAPNEGAKENPDDKSIKEEITDSAIENSVSQESSVVELSNSVKENSASQESSDVELSNSTKENSASQESSVVELSESSRGSEETLSAKETESLMECSDSEEFGQTINTIEPGTQKTDDSKDEPIIEGTAEESKGVNEESTKTDKSNVKETIVKEPALETEDSKADDAETEKIDVEMVEEKTTNVEKCENTLCEEKSENSSSAENAENPLNEENSNEMEVDQDLAVDKSTSAEKSEVHQEEDASACADEPELEVIDDSSEKKSLDSGATDMKSDNTAEKDAKKEEEIEVMEDASAKASMDSETCDMKTTDNASENSAEKKRVPFIPIDLGEDPGELQDFTAQEIMDYLGKKINEYMSNPEINDLMRVQLESVQLRDQVRAKMEEMNRLQTFMEKMNRDQEKLLRHYGIIPKLPTRDVAVFVDMPALDTSSTLHSNNVKEQIQKNEQLTLIPCGTIPKGTVSATNIAGGASVLKKSAVSKKDGPVECIDLTDEMEAPSNKTINKAPTFKTYSTTTHQSQIKSPNTLHPAPLPIMPNRVNRYLKETPPKPRVKISCDDKGIILQWDADITSKHEKLQCFEIFGYQEQKTQNVTSALWKRIGSVKTLSLPMACTLTKFVPGNNYHFTVRGLDIHNRPGIFSEPVSTRFDPLPKKS